MVGDCYFCATGIYVWNFSEWKLNPHVDGLNIVDCSVPNESLSFGDVKKLFRLNPAPGSNARDRALGARSLFACGLYSGSAMRARPLQYQTASANSAAV